MNVKIQLPPDLQGLSDDAVLQSRKHHGMNVQHHEDASTWWKVFLNLLKEPMLILLIGVALIYILLGQTSDAYFMLFAIVIVSGISFYQDHRSKTSLKALEVFNTPLSQVIRNGKVEQIPTPEIVPGDLVMNEEGSTLQADGEIRYSHDFSINESTLTGESQPVYKSESRSDGQVYQGTWVSSGLVVFEAKSTGLHTKMGQLGTSLLAIKDEQTPLQGQIRRFVKNMTFAGILVFFLLWGVHFYKTHLLLDSLLKGMTLAMSILPEEIPVAFTTFMAIGAWKMMKRGIIVKKMQTVEALGSITVLCADKTGTITENRMSFAGLFSNLSGKTYDEETAFDHAAMEVIEAAMWSSEPLPYDPMETTIHQLYADHAVKDQRPFYKMIHEYPLSGSPPMMTHLHENEYGDRIIAAKGAPETILRLCHLAPEQQQKVADTLDIFTSNGYRVLGVATAQWKGNQFPGRQEDFPFSFIGLIAFHDPPKPGIRDVFDAFYEAGIQVKVFTGDNEHTTKSIARLAGIRGYDHAMDGEKLMKLNHEAFQHTVKDNILFSRMFPEAKLAAVRSLKEDHHIVAMVGDGVNDGPALKSAHIGIAMGKKGTEIAKSAAALVLVKDDLSTLVEGVAAGRRIYTNLKKAIQYIISIHIPIILTVSIPLLLGWKYPAIFTPIHVIFLELIMGPTCSVAYENEPMEKNAMRMPPRTVSQTFFRWHEITISLIQGLMITAGVMAMYLYHVSIHAAEPEVRTAVFLTLIFANIWLTLVNRSFYFSFIETFRYRNRLLTGIMLATLFITGIMITVPVIRDFFLLAPADWTMIGYCAATALMSVLWIEIVKWRRRSRQIRMPA